MATAQDAATTGLVEQTALLSLTTGLSGPVARVLGTTELLEQVLLKLPLRDTLLAQNVCRRWKAVIETSPALQQKLWLKSATSPLLDYELDHLQNITLNPFFHGLFDSYAMRDLEPLPQKRFQDCEEIHLRRHQPVPDESSDDVNTEIYPSYESMALTSPPVRAVYLDGFVCQYKEYLRGR
jgi:hypothetical protein